METTLQKVQTQKPHPDPVIRRKIDNALKLIELSSQFKRIDISFLQMTDKDSNNPKFAILTYEDYVSGMSCSCNHDGWNGRFSDIANKEKLGRKISDPKSYPMGTMLNPVSCNPTKAVPETVDALVQENKDQFDEIFVAWEAEWNPIQEDPIVIGRKDDLFFIMAQWDMSKIESYVVAEF